MGGKGERRGEGEKGEGGSEYFSHLFLLCYLNVDTCMTETCSSHALLAVVCFIIIVFIGTSFVVEHSEALENSDSEQLLISHVGKATIHCYCI